jgi:leucyl aminopeptidase
MSSADLPELDVPVVACVPALAEVDPDGSAPEQVLLAVDPGHLAPLLDLGVDAAGLLATYEPATTAGSCTVIPLPPGGPLARRAAFLATGEFRPADLRCAGAELGRAARDRELLVVALPRLEVGQVRALVEGILLGGFTGPTWATRRRSRAVRRIVIVGQDPRAVSVAVAHATATCLARQLAAVPSNIKSPAWLAAQARTVARRAGLDVRVRTEAALKKEGFGGLLAVGGASATPPRFVELGYDPAPVADPPTRRRAATVPHVVLVGKGITFDSGGLDVKPAAGMLTMKTDMSGAAVVLGVLAACRAVGVRARVTGLLAIAENAISGTAYRPGDVVTQYGGTTVEIGNTDAEGRIVLADALAYADAHLDPDVVIDIATLTGAATIALGRAMGPLFSTDEALSDALLAAGEAAGEPMWPFPLVEEYRTWLDSPVADLNHVAAAKVGQAGSIVAALFLREFTGGRRWAHLDIAGPGRSDRDAGTVQEGPTGYGARLLLRYLESLSGPALADSSTVSV